MNLTSNSITAMWIATAIWAGVLIVLLLFSPTFRARCLASLIAISYPDLRLRIYIEKTKHSGERFSKTTCVALVGRDGSVYRVLYGTPNLSALRHVRLPDAINCYKIVARRIKY